MWPEKQKTPHCLHAPQHCTMLTPVPLSPSRPKRRSEPLQPAVKTLTHRLPRRKKTLSVMRRSTPCEEEAFIHLFCLFSKTNRGQDYAATLIALCLLQLNFKLGGSPCPLLWSLQSLPAAFQAPQQNLITQTFTCYISFKQSQKTNLFSLSPVWSSKKRLLVFLTCGIFIGHQMAPFNLLETHSHRFDLQCVTAWCVVRVDLLHE